MVQRVKERESRKKKNETEKKNGFRLRNRVVENEKKHKNPVLAYKAKNLCN